MNLACVQARTAFPMYVQTTDRCEKILFSVPSHRVEYCYDNILITRPIIFFIFLYCAEYRVDLYVTTDNYLDSERTVAL